jgi:hypothetical protein
VFDRTTKKSLEICGLIFFAPKQKESALYRKSKCSCVFYKMQKRILNSWYEYKKNQLIHTSIQTQSTNTQMPEQIPTNSLDCIPQRKEEDTGKRMR